MLCIVCVLCVSGGGGGGGLQSKVRGKGRNKVIGKRRGMDQPTLNHTRLGYPEMMQVCENASE